MGLFHAFYNDKSVKMIGVEPSGTGMETGQHAATMTLGKPGIIHGFKCYNLQDDKGEPLPVHSIAAGLDYPGVGPEHSHFKDINRCDYVTASDQDAIDGFKLLSKQRVLFLLLKVPTPLAMVSNWLKHYLLTKLL